MIGTSEICNNFNLDEILSRLALLLMLSGIFISVAHAEDPPEFSKDISAVLARAETKADSTVKLSVPGLSIFARRKSIEDGWVMELSGKTKKGDFKVRHVFDGVADYPDEIVIVELDPSNDVPEIMFSAFTGGAHCCSQAVIAYELNGRWITLDLPMLDGGPPQFEDIDSDGVAELVSIDQTFLYAFDCYACSWSPLRIEILRQGVITDVTRAMPNLVRIREQLAFMENAAKDDEELWRGNGFLAGWVAVKTLLGEEREAWQKMLLLYDRKSDFLEVKCFDPAIKFEDCAKDKLESVPFPVSLEHHLIKQKYINSPVN